jgi:putative heme iron utilization protein
MGWFRMTMIHTKLIKMKWGMFKNILQIAGVDQEQVGETPAVHQTHGWFRIAMMQTKLIRIKWERFWNILEVE